MKNDESRLSEQVALFRHGLVAPLAQRALQRGELQRALDEAASHEYVIPGSNRSRVAEATIRDWLRAYKAGGFDALKPRPRRDAGETRALAPEVVEALAAVKEATPALSVRLVIKTARDTGKVAKDVRLPPSTVHRALQARGLMDKAAAPTVDRRRFCHMNAGDLWMSDVMHGPRVNHKKTYLICFIDDATRVIPFAAFCASEGVTAFLPVFKTALKRRGIPQRLFVDNGANYRCHQLSVICARLGITLIHARPYSPESKGKQERFFRTLRAAFLARLGEVTSLDEMNRKLWTWVESEYHATPHGGLDNVTPLDAWARKGERVRYPDASVDLDALFKFEASRVVARDRTVSLHGRLLEVDAALVGMRVVLRYDPGKPDGNVEVYSDGKPAGIAAKLDVHINAGLPRVRFSSDDSEED